MCVVTHTHTQTHVYACVYSIQRVDNSHIHTRIHMCLCMCVCLCVSAGIPTLFVWSGGVYQRNTLQHTATHCNTLCMCVYLCVSAGIPTRRGMCMSVCVLINFYMSILRINTHEILSHECIPTREYSLFCRALLQNRPMILRSLLIGYTNAQSAGIPAKSTQYLHGEVGGWGRVPFSRIE